MLSMRFSYMSRKRKHTYTDEQLKIVITVSRCWAEVCRSLGIPPASGSQTHLARRAKAAGMNHSHFVGRAWNKGRTFPEKHPIEYYLVKGSTIHSASLRRKLVRSGLKAQCCELCGLAEWCGRSIPLELDHKNSDHWDNRLENLQIVCPNCHAQVTDERRSTPSGERAVLETVEAQAIAGSIPVCATKLCMDCKKEISPKAKKCKSCAARGQKTKIAWPPIEVIRKRLETESFLSLSKELSVSDNAVRKHLRSRQAQVNVTGAHMVGEMR